MAGANLIFEENKGFVLSFEMDIRTLTIMGTKVIGNIVYIFKALEQKNQIIKLKDYKWYPLVAKHSKP